MDDLLAWLRLQFTPGLGRTGLIRLITHYQTPQVAIEAAPAGWPQVTGVSPEHATRIPAAADPIIQRACRQLEEAGARLVTLWDANYPSILKTIADPPALLYCCGQLPNQLALAVVGSRYPTEVGRLLTERLAAEVAAAGVTIISGMARGIDAAAHRGALRSNGHTVAVLGCGIDRVYPPEHETLYQQLCEQGGLLSEYPPGTAPLAGHFPGRNRIISGLSQATLVVEAAEKSGSLITAEFALEQGRDVLAVPGGVDRRTSYGPNLLIKQGAHPVTETAEVLQVLGVDPVRGASAEPLRTAPIRLPGPAGKVLLSLGLSPRHSDEIAGESGLTPRELSVILLQLELQGYVEKRPGGCYVLSQPAVAGNRSMETP